MGSINFTQFNLKTPLCATDFLVGIRADNTEEIKTTVRDVLNLYDLGQIRTLSTNWNNTYTNVNQNSGYWNTAFDSVSLTNSSYTTLNTNSANWDSTYTTVQNNSSFWVTDSTADTEVRELTSNWESTYTTVNENSADWLPFSVYETLTSGEITDFSESDIWILSALPIVLPKAGAYEFKFTHIQSSLSASDDYTGFLNVVHGISSSNLINFKSVSENIQYLLGAAEGSQTSIGDCGYLENKTSLPWYQQVRNDIDPLNIDHFNTMQGFLQVEEPTTFYYYISAIVPFTKPSVGKGFYILNYKPNATFNAF
jgi:hypothetical protein